MKSSSIEVEVDEEQELRAQAIADRLGLDVNTVLSQILITGYLFEKLQREASD